MNKHKGSSRHQNAIPPSSVPGEKHTSPGSPKSEEPTSTSNGQNKAWSRKEILQALFNGLLVLFTLVLAVVSIMQWDVTRENMRVGNRAYLALGQIQIYCPICETDQITLPTKAIDNNASINLFFVNSGHSPARDIDWNAMLDLKPIDASFAFPEKPDVLEQPKHPSVQPSTQFPLQITRGTRAEIILMARGTRVGATNGPIERWPLCVYGHVSYTDVFDKRHTLIYCANYQPASTVGPESWGMCPYHNEEYDGNYDPLKK